MDVRTVIQKDPNHTNEDHLPEKLLFSEQYAYCDLFFKFLLA